MEHEYYKSCNRDNCDGSCILCTLAVCKVCGLIEGSLTTDCPGVDAFKEHGDAVYAGTEDFRDGQWVKACSDASPAKYRHA